MIAILHNIRSLHNVGSIFRTADGLGFEKIYLCGITPSPIDRFGEIRPQLGKVSLGAETFVPWEKVKSTVSLIKKLKKDGWKIAAIEQDQKAAPYYTECTMMHHSALVVGSEVRGISPSILKLCDAVLEIPMKGKKESLNVAVAFGIVAAHLTFNSRR